MANQQKLLEMYARLKALRTNIPERASNLHKRWVDEFHTLVDDLVKLSALDLKGFRVPPRAIRLQQGM